MQIIYFFIQIDENEQYKFKLVLHIFINTQLEEWWLNCVYQECRVPCALYVNPGLQLSAQNVCDQGEQLE